MKNNLSFARQKGRPPFDYPLNYSNAAEPGKKRSREALPSLSFLPSTFHLRPRHRGFRGTPTTVRFRPTPSFIITSIHRVPIPTTSYTSRRVVSTVPFTFAPRWEMIVARIEFRQRILFKSVGVSLEFSTPCSRARNRALKPRVSSNFDARKFADSEDLWQRCSRATGLPLISIFASPTLSLRPFILSSTPLVYAYAIVTFILPSLSTTKVSATKEIEKARVI